MIIKRDVYLNRLISKMNNGMIKVITGIRRCGKSFLLFELFYSFLKEHGINDNQIIRIQLDDDNYEKCRDSHVLNNYINEQIKDSKTNYYVLIDEAQYAITKEEIKNHDEPIKLYGVLNGLLNKRNVDVYITGSNSKFLSSDVMTEFRGRGDEVHIAPLSFSEFVSAFNGDKYDAWREYSMYGGLPHLFVLKSDTDKVDYLKDLIERYSIKHSEAMENLMKILASSIGSLSSSQKISDTFVSTGQKGISMPTISDYMSKLEETFIVQKVERYDIKGRRYISTPSKYYYTDIGFRNALLNFRQYEETHIMENIIYNELVYRGYNVDVGLVATTVSENGSREYKQFEVDFVANLGSKRYYIQSAYSIPNDEKMQQEQNSLERIPDSFKKLIVVYGNSPLWRNDKGITIMSIFDFLLNKDSLDL